MCAFFLFILLLLLVCVCVCVCACVRVCVRVRERERVCIHHVCIRRPVLFFFFFERERDSRALLLLFLSSESSSFSLIFIISLWVLALVGCFFFLALFFYVLYSIVCDHVLKVLVEREQHYALWRKFVSFECHTGQCNAVVFTKDGPVRCLMPVFVTIKFIYYIYLGTLW